METKLLYSLYYAIICTTAASLKANVSPNNICACMVARAPMRFVSCFPNQTVCFGTMFGTLFGVEQR